MTALLIIGLIIVAAVLVAIFALTCVGPSTEYSFQHRTRNSRTRNRRRHFIRFGNGAPSYGNAFGRSDSPGSDSFPDSLSISPSRPTVFGDAKDVEGVVKVVLTPPTPARREHQAWLTNADDEDRI